MQRSLYLRKTSPNLYQVQKDSNITFQGSEVNFRKFLNEMFQLLCVTNHRSTILGASLLQETVILNKFRKIRQTLHVHGNTKTLSSRFAIARSQRKSTFVCMSKFIHGNMENLHTQQTTQIWLKNLRLSSISSVTNEKEVEAGKENMVLQGEPDLGALSIVFLRLARMIPRHQNFLLYFENYSTSLCILEYLVKEGFLSDGTVKRNIIRDC